MPPATNQPSTPAGNDASGAQAATGGLSFASARGGGGGDGTNSSASQGGGADDPLLQTAPPPASAPSGDSGGSTNGSGSATGDSGQVVTTQEDGGGESTVSFAVQFGTFADQARATEMLTALQALGVGVHIVVETDVNNRRWYAVRTPAFVDQAAAEHAAVAIRDRHGLSSLVMAQPSGGAP